MKTKHGVLVFLESKNPPVFKTPMNVRWTHDPHKDEPFIFGNEDHMETCNLSTVQQIKRIDNCLLIKTRNSTYALYVKESE